MWTLRCNRRCFKRRGAGGRGRESLLGSFARCPLPRIFRAPAFAGRGARALRTAVRRAMSAATKAISWSGLKRRALSLGAVKAFDHALAVPAAGGADALPGRGDLRRVPAAVAGRRHGDDHRHAQHGGRPVLLRAALRRARQAPLHPPDDAVPRRLGPGLRRAGRPVEPAAARGARAARAIRLAGAGVRRAVGGLDPARLAADHRRAHPLAGLCDRHHRAPARGAGRRRRVVHRRAARDPLDAARLGAGEARAARSTTSTGTTASARRGSSARRSPASSGTARPSAFPTRSIRCARSPTSGSRRACSRSRASPRSRSRRSSATWCTSCATR